MRKRTQQIEEQLESASLALLVAGFFQSPVVEPLQSLGSLNEVARPLGVLLKLVTIHLVCMLRYQKVIGPAGTQ